MLDLKINHLQLLAQIVSTGSLTEAAQNLGLSAAAASRMLKKLQTEMNDPLFIRVWRGLTPTDTTTMMLPVVRELLDQMERLEYQKSFTPAKLSATITIGAADNSVISILPPVVRAIREQAPKVNSLTAAWTFCSTRRRTCRIFRHIFLGSIFFALSDRY